MDPAEWGNGRRIRRLVVRSWVVARSPGRTTASTDGLPNDKETLGPWVWSGGGGGAAPRRLVGRPRRLPHHARRRAGRGAEEGQPRLGQGEFAVLRVCAD